LAGIHHPTEAPHATPELSRWCRARHPRHFEQIPSKTIPANRIWREVGNSVGKQIIKSGQFLIRGLSIWRDRPSINPQNFKSFPFTSFPSVCSRVSRRAVSTNKGVALRWSRRTRCHRAREEHRNMHGGGGGERAWLSIRRLRDGAQRNCKNIVRRPRTASRASPNS